VHKKSQSINLKVYLGCLEDLGIDGKVILKRVLETQHVDYVQMTHQDSTQWQAFTNMIMAHFVGETTRKVNTTTELVTRQYSNESEQKTVPVSDCFI
jgi:hypothetical protein